MCLDGEKNDRVAFQARADYQNHAIGWLHRGYSSLGGGKVVRIPRIWMAYGECRVNKSARRPVSRVLFPPRREMAIHLGRPLPDASCDRPGQRRGNTPAGETPACRPYLVLLPVGFTVPPPLPGARCALTAPFHPYPPSRQGAAAGGLLSVALSLGSPPPGITRHRVPVEPGLSSPGGALPRRKRPSGRLASGG